MPAVALDGEFRTRRGVHEFLNVSLPAELDHGKGAGDVHVVHEPDVVERRLDARVLPEMEDDVRRFGHAGVDVFGVTAPILRAGNVILRAAGEIIVERDDFRAGGGDELLDDLRPDVTRASSDQNGAHVQATVGRPIE